MAVVRTPAVADPRNGCNVGTPWRNVRGDWCCRAVRTFKFLCGELTSRGCSEAPQVLCRRRYVAFVLLVEGTVVGLLVLD
jgi:hypothetical protein